MIGDHQHVGIVVQQFQEGADLLVDIGIVVVDEGFVRIAWNVLTVLGIVVFPETVMHPVDTDFDELEVVPFER